MSIVSWNCRGLGNPQAVRDLRFLVKDKKPTLVFLIETKLKAPQMETIKATMKFDNVFTVDCVGRSGGMALLWKSEFSVDIQNYSRRHINVIVSLRGEGQSWKLTDMYGHPDTP
jgi:exonuclease III